MTRRALLAAVPALLPAASSPADARKQAVLKWAEEDAAAEEASGNAGRARAIRASLADFAAAAEEPGSTPSNLFPAIPRPESNEYLAKAVRSAEKLARSDTRYPKGPAGNVVHSDSEGWRFINICTQALELTSAFCHPQSPLRGDATLLAPLLRRFATVYEYLTPGAKNLADFGISPWLSEMYLLLRTGYPDALPPVYRESWEKAIQTNADAIVEKYGAVFRAAIPGTGYPNSHTHYINALLFAGLTLKRSDYLEIAESGVKLMATCLYGDGGFCYIGEQNECFTYHPIAVRDLVRYWQVTGKAAGRELAVRTRWYYPLSVEPPGVAEYSTAPSWKPYWNQIAGGDGAALVAGLTGCPHNLRIARENSPDPNFWLAGFWRNDVKPAAAPDRYVTWDRNIEGPRGRFGRFSFSGTSRDYGDDARGKLTYAGCMALDGGTSHWPLSAALHAAGAEVRIKPGPGDTNRWTTHLCLARGERNAATVNERFAALSTTHKLCVYGGPATGWEAAQQWIFTPRRMVGMVTLTASSPQRAYSMGGAIQLLSGRASWGVRKEFEQLDAKTWKYGALVVRIHAHDLAAVRPEYTDVMGGTGGKSGRLVLSDGETETGVRDYAAGTRRTFLIEVHPEWNREAELVRTTEAPNGCFGVEVRDGDLHVRMIHNAGDSDAIYTSEVQPAGEQFRAAWLESGGVAAAARTRTIKAGSHGILS